MGDLFSKCFADTESEIGLQLLEAGGHPARSLHEHPTKRGAVAYMLRRWLKQQVETAFDTVVPKNAGGREYA